MLLLASTVCVTAAPARAVDIGGTFTSISIFSFSPITQSAPVTVTGTTDLNSGPYDITLALDGNDFQGPVSLAGHSVFIADSNAIDLGTSSVAFYMNVLTNGAITQSGALTVSGDATIDAGSGSIALDNSSNDFSGRVSLKGRAVQITDSNELRLGTLYAGSLTATSNGALSLGSGEIAGSLVATSNGGAITQEGALRVTGSSAIDAGTGAITLTDAGNDFVGPMTLTGSDVSVRDANDLTVASLSNSGSVSLIAGGTLSLAAQAIDTGTGSLTLASNGGVLSTSGDLSGASISLTGRDGVVLANNVTASGNFAANSSGGSIVQAGGALAIAGTSSIDAGTGTISMTSAANDFAGPVSLTGGSVAITDSNALTLGTLSTASLTASSFGNLNLGSGTVSGNLAATSNGGAISQSGALTVTGTSSIDAGSGAITLMDAGNDFAGAVSLTGGAVQMADSNALTLGTLSTGSLTAISTGALNFGSGTISGNLQVASNGGAMTQTGALTVTGTSVLNAGTGAVTLTNAANDFQGALSITAGAVQIADVNDLAIASLTQTANGPVSLTAGGALTLSAQPIDATGDLLLASNGGILTTSGDLSGANITLTGRDGIFIDQDVTAANTLTLNSAQGSVTQDSAASVITAATLTGSASGDVSLTGANQIAELADFTAANFSLADATALDVTGTLTASKVSFDDAAGVTVTGMVDAVQTVMESGRLTVGVNGVGSITGALQINAGATLAGTGTVGTSHVLSGGMISQQVAAATQSVPATLNVAGDLILDSGSTYVVNASGGSSDLLAVSGSATIAPGAVMLFSPQGPLAVGDSYTVLTAAGGVNGTFDFDVAPSTAFLGLTDVYTANSVQIEFAQVRSFQSAALTPNQFATGGGLDSIAGGSALVSALQQLPDDSSAQAAFDLLSGEIHPPMQAVQVEDTRIPRGAVLQRLAGPGTARGAWVQAVGNWGSSHGRDGASADFDRDTTAILGGIDTAIGGNARVGLAGGYTSTDVKMPDRLSSGKVDSYHVLGYFGVRSHAFGIRGGLGYSSNDISATRSVAFPGFTDSLRSKRDGHAVQAFGEIGYRLPLGSLTVEPIAALTQVWAHAGNFTESGGPAALSGESESLNSTSTVAGLRLRTTRAGPFRLSGLLGWKHRFGDRTPSERLAFQGGAPFEITAAGLSKDAAVIDAEASFALSRGVSLSAAYRGEFGDRGEDNMVRGTLAIAF